LKKLSGDFFHFLSFLRSEIWTRPYQNVEHRQFIFRQLLADVTLLFVIERAT
jgi:hypothetical protein